MASVCNISDVTDEALKDNLMMLIGEDGTVMPEREVVEEYLKSRDVPTHIQIINLRDSQVNDNGEMTILTEKMTFYPENMRVQQDENKNSDVATEVDDSYYIAASLSSIKLDHDYTSLIEPGQEDDDLAKTMRILHDETPPKTSTVKPTKSINIISNIKIPPRISTKNATRYIITNAGKLVPMTASSVEVPNETETTKKAEPENSKGKAKEKTKVGRPPKKINSQIDKSDDEEEDSDENPLSDEEDDEAESNGEEEEEEDGEDDLEMDDDSDDSDFDIKEEITGKKSKKHKKIPEPPRRPTRLSESIRAPAPSPKILKTYKPSRIRMVVPKNVEAATSMALPVSPVVTGAALPVTSVGTGTAPPVTPVVKKDQKVIKTVEKPTTEIKLEEKLPETDQKVEKEEPKLEELKQQEKKTPKKKKEPPKVIPGDFALFSTPDIIRKVAGKEPTTPEATATPKQIKDLKPPKTDSPTALKPAKISQESRSKSTITESLSDSPKKITNRLSLDEKNPQRSEIKNKERRESVDKQKHSRSEERQSSGSQRLSETEKNHKPKPSQKSDYSRHSKHSSENQEVIPSPADIRAIIMNEDIKTFTTDTVLSTDAPVHQESGISLHESGLDLDQSILDNINSDMISEDILYQVAKQLVSNTELQNAIDKGINEGVLDTSGIDMSEVTPSIDKSFSEQNQSNIIKEGKEIVRPDGTILKLPPIERPTTRSRNKQTPVSTPAKPGPKPKPSFKTNHKPLDKEHVSGNELSSGDEEEQSEDDPNKLWCLCNQPHNNRFMICCDTCEEWYHGRCVGITKAMGQQMESEGKEWMCLYCKDSKLKRPLPAQKRIRRASRHSTHSTDSSNSAKNTIATEKPAVATLVPCVVCQKAARKNSIYCSEPCILAHAQKIEKVVVIEKSSGKMLSGAKAPTAVNLDQWLKDHPGYQVVKPGGKVATSNNSPRPLAQSQLKIVKNANNHGVSLAVQQKGVNIGVLKHAPKHPQPQESKAAKFYKVFQRDPNSKVKLIQPQPMKPKEASTPPPKAKVQVQTLLTPKLTPKTPPVQTPKKTPELPKGKTPKSKPKDETPTPRKKEDIRDNVKKTIFEQLTVRLKGNDNIKLTEEEIKNISTEIETELYKCFGDTGQKYKNKYRSLMFNVKDPKNQTLWRRICEKSISSYELVRLSPDDMASQELAKWREQEAKHQLDMIKKSEIELLNCNRQYVLKTHKGEEVLEDNRPGIKSDNIEIIKSLTEGTALDTGVDAKRPKSSHKDKSKDKDRHSSKDRREERSKKRSRSKSKDRSRSEKKKKRSRSRSRDKSKDRERNRDRHRKSSSSSKSSKHKKPLSSSTDTLDKRSKEILEQLNRIVPPVEEKISKQENILPDPPASMDSESDHEVPTSTVTIPTPPRVTDIEEFSSEESKTPKEEEGLEEEGGLSPPPQSTPALVWSGTIEMNDVVSKVSITAHEVSGDCSGLGQELAERLKIVGRISPAIAWDYIGQMRSSNTKIISLIRLTAKNVEEQILYMTLYSYLSKRNRLGVVESTNRSIKDFYILPLPAQKPIPLSLLPLNGPGFEEARPALLLGIIVRDQRKRSVTDSLPVVTPRKKHKVEVHVQVLPSRSYTPPPMPPEVAPAPPPPLPPLPPTRSESRLLAELPVSPAVPSHLSPSIISIVKPPKVSPSLAKHEMSKETVAADDDEPYSPEDSDPDTPDTTANDTMQQSTISTKMSSDTTTTSHYSTIPGLGDGMLPTKLDMQRQMEELNKQIEQQKSEITSITKNIATSADSEIVGSALASIALPSNLQQILDSIKTISGDTASSDSSSSQTAPAPEQDLTIPLIIPKTFSRPISETIPLNLPTKSKLALNESSSSSSVLSSLTEADLIKKANEMLEEEEKDSKKKVVPKTPPPPSLVSFSIVKKSKLDVKLPPVPGIDD